jgi:sugar phosphate permease
MLNTSGNIAGIVAPAVTGAIVTATGSWDVALFISAALSVAGVIVLGAFSRRLPAGVPAPQPAAAPTAADDGYRPGT